MSDLVPPSSGEKIIPVNVEDEMRASYLDYAMSVIIGRALPDVRDGLKPVHRRVLYAMHELGNHYNRTYKKSARIVGDVIGKYHPHGDQAVYDTLVRMAQDFSLRHLLVDGQGNFGSIDGDPPAAMRYTEVRMTRLASELLADIDKHTVDFSPNYDASLEEPQVLPTKVPNLLINGSSGIAVGMATNIPPHNLYETIEAAIALAFQPELTTRDLLKHLPGPDFPTGGIVYGTHGLRNAYETGRGVIQLRGRAEIEQHGKGSERIVIGEIPYQVNKTTLIEKIADLVRDKRIEGISDIRDESDRDGMRLVIDIKRDANGDVVLNQLYSTTSLQISFGFNMLAIVGGQPKILGLKELLQHFLAHRREVITRRSRFELQTAQKRFNVVYGLLAAVDAIDRLIHLIRSSPDQAAAKTALLAEQLQPSAAFLQLSQQLVTFPFAQADKLKEANHLYLNEGQAQAILDMRLARLTGLERDKLAEEGQQLQQTIVHLQSILASSQKLREVMVQELRTIQTSYQNPRKTELVADARQMSVEDLIADEEVVITLSHAGYVKRNPTDLYQAQRRGGRGKTAVTTREEDFVETIFVTRTHSHVLIFTNKGKVYGLKAHEIPQAGRATRGKPLINLIRVEPDERVAAVLPVESFEAGKFIVMVTRCGLIKKTDLMAFANPRASGLIALTIEAEDSLSHVGITDGQRDILLATKSGLAIRFDEGQVRPMGRTARGVRAIHLKRANDAVVGMVLLDSSITEILTLSSLGYGKRTAAQEYRPQGRGGSGIINLKITERNGEVVSVCGITPEDHFMVVTNRGMMLRTTAEQISRVGRAAQGVKIMTLAEGELISSLARLVEPDVGQGKALDEADLADGDATEPMAEVEVEDPNPTTH